MMKVEGQEIQSMRSVAREDMLFTWEGERGLDSIFPVEESASVLATAIISPAFLLRHPMTGGSRRLAFAERCYHCISRLPACPNTAYYVSSILINNGLR
jgi:hypothetical protein